MPRSYAYSAGLNWADYLKVNEIRDVGEDIRNVQYEISSANRDLIATNEQLTQMVSLEIQDAATEICSSLNNGFYEISGQLQGLQDTVSDLSDIIRFGFENLTEAVDRLNDSIIELIKIARTPAQTWAYNQFEIAREAYSKRLYPEALEALEQAISGRGDNPGYKLEYRFHFLKGDIHLGNAKSLDLSVVDAAAAEEAFLNAARYASNEFPQEAAKAFVAAAFAAYVQGKMVESLEYCKKGIALESSMGEGWFQLAKNHMHLGYLDKALPSLRNAIDINREYVFKAESDDDFLSYPKEIKGLYQEIIDQKKIIFHKSKKRIDDKLRQLESWWKKDEISESAISTKKIINKAIDGFNTSTVLGSYESIKLLQMASDEIDVSINDRKNDLKKELIDLSSHIKKYINNNKTLGEKRNKIMFIKNASAFKSIEGRLGVPSTFESYNSTRNDFLKIFDEIKKNVNCNVKKSKIFRLILVILGSIFLGFVFFVIAFFIGGLILGEIMSWFYGKAYGYDTVHNVTGMICGAIAFLFGVVMVVGISSDHPLEKPIE